VWIYPPRLCAPWGRGYLGPTQSRETINFLYDNSPCWCPVAPCPAWRSASRMDPGGMFKYHEFSYDWRVKLIDTLLQPMIY